MNKLIITVLIAFATTAQANPTYISADGRSVYTEVTKSEYEALSPQEQLQAVFTNATKEEYDAMIAATKATEQRASSLEKETQTKTNEKVTTNQYDADSDKREFRKQWGGKNGISIEYCLKITRQIALNSLIYSTCDRDLDALGVVQQTYNGSLCEKLLYRDELVEAFSDVKKQIATKQNEAGNQTEFCDVRKSSHYWTIKGGM